MNLQERIAAAMKATNIGTAAPEPREPDAIPSDMTEQDRGEHLYALQADSEAMGMIHGKYKIGKTKTDALTRYQDQPEVMNAYSVIMDKAIKDAGKAEELALAVSKPTGPNLKANSFSPGQTEFVNKLPKNLLKGNVQTLDDAYKNIPKSWDRKKGNRYKVNAVGEKIEDRLETAQHDFIKENVGRVLDKQGVSKARNLEELVMYSEYKDEKTGGTWSSEGVHFEDLMKNKIFRSKSQKILTKIMPETILPAKDGEKIRLDAGQTKHLLGLLSNNISALGASAYSDVLTKGERKDLAMLLQMHGHSNMDWGAAATIAEGTVSDPLTWISGGISKVIAKAGGGAVKHEVSRQASKKIVEDFVSGSLSKASKQELTKEGLRREAKDKVITTGFTALDGAISGAGDAASREKLATDKTSAGTVVAGGMIGAAAGLALGKSLDAILGGSAAEVKNHSTQALKDILKENPDKVDATLKGQSKETRAEVIKWITGEDAETLNEIAQANKPGRKVKHKPKEWERSEQSLQNIEDVSVKKENIIEAGEKFRELKKEEIPKGTKLTQEQEAQNKQVQEVVDELEARKKELEAKIDQHDNLPEFDKLVKISPLYNELEQIDANIEEARGYFIAPPKDDHGSKTLGQATENLMVEYEEKGANKRLYGKNTAMSPSSDKASRAEMVSRDMDKMSPVERVTARVKAFQGNRQLQKRFGRLAATFRDVDLSTDVNKQTEAFGLHLMNQELRGLDKQLKKNGELDFKQAEQYQQLLDAIDNLAPKVEANRVKTKSQKFREEVERKFYSQDALRYKTTQEEAFENVKDDILQEGSDIIATIAELEQAKPKNRIDLKYSTKDTTKIISGAKKMLEQLQDQLDKANGKMVMQTGGQWKGDFKNKVHSKLGHGDKQLLKAAEELKAAIYIAENQTEGLDVDAAAFKNIFVLKKLHNLFDVSSYKSFKSVEDAEQYFSVFRKLLKETGDNRQNLKWISDDIGSTKGKPVEATLEKYDNKHRLNKKTELYRRFDPAAEPKGAEKYDREKKLNNLLYGKKHRDKVQNFGDNKITDAEQALIDELGYERAAEALEPQTMVKGTEAKVRHNLFEELRKQFADKLYSESGLGTKNSVEAFFRHGELEYDAVNSMAQIMSGLTRDRPLAEGAGMKHDFDPLTDDFRLRVRDQIKQDLGIELSKDNIKELWTPFGYGEGLKAGTLTAERIVNELKSNVSGTELYSAFLKGVTEHAKGFINVNQWADEVVANMLRRGESKIKLNLMDGYTINVNYVKDAELKATFASKKRRINIEGGSVDTLSKALVPAIIQGLDAIAIKRIMKRTGAQTTHDSMRLKSDNFAKLAKDEYAKFIEDLFNNPILRKMEQDTGVKLPEGTIGTHTANRETLRKQSILEKEYDKGDVDQVKIETKDLDIRDSSDATWEAFSLGNIYGLDSNLLVTKLVSMAPYIDLSTISNKTPMHKIAEAALWINRDMEHAQKLMEEAVAEATKGTNLSVDEANIIARDTVMSIRGMMELNPLMDNKLEGRMFFGKDGSLIGTDTNVWVEKLERKVESEWKDKYNTTVSQRIIRKTMGNQWNPLRLQQTVGRIDYLKTWTPEDLIATINFDREIKLLRRQTLIGRLEAKTLRKVRRFAKPVIHSSLGKYLSSTMTVSDRKVQEWWNQVHYDRKDLQTTSDAILKTIREEVAKSGMSEHEVSTLMFKTGLADIGSFHVNGGKFKALSKLELQKIVDNAPEHIAHYAKAIESIKSGLFQRKNKFGHWIGDIVQDMERQGFDIETAREAEDAVRAKVILDATSDAEWAKMERNPELAGMIQRMVFNQRQHAEATRGESKNFDMFWYPALKKDSVDVYGNLDSSSGYEIGITPLKSMTSDVMDNMKSWEYSKFKELAKDVGNHEAAQQLGLRFDGKSWKKIKVAADEVAGSTRNASDILTEMYRRTNDKISDRRISEQIWNDAKGDNVVYSDSLKPGYVEIPKDRLGRLAPEFRENLYIKEEYLDLAIGQKGIGLFGKDSARLLRVGEQIYKELVQTFKANVTLGNPSSWINNFLFGGFMNMIAGVPTKDVARLQKVAYQHINDAFELKESIIRDQTKGLTPKGKINRLERMDIIKAEKDGLAIGLVEGLAAQNKVLNTGLEKLLGDSYTNKMVSNITLQGTSATRQLANKGFTYVDGMGRYSLYLHYKNIGMNGLDAAKRANSMYGDSRIMAPTFVRALDEYGIIPFFKWFTTVAPGIISATAEHPIRALGVTAGLIAFKNLANIRTSGYSPLEGLEDFGMTLDDESNPRRAAKYAYDKAQGREIKDWETRWATPYVLPAALYKTYRVYGNEGSWQDYLGIVAPKNNRKESYGN